MRRRWLDIRLSEKQQLAVALLLVVLLAISLLYCLGFASLALRQSWENVPIPWSETAVPPTDAELVPTAPPTVATLPP